MNNSAAMDDLTDLNGPAADYAFALPVVRPSSDLKSRLLAGISSSPAESVDKIHVVRGGSEGWMATPYPGVTFKKLSFDKQTSMITSLLKLEAGAVYPPHRHNAPEQCLVLEGDVFSGALELSAGDYQIAEAGSNHGAISTRNGCLLLMVSSTRDEILA